MNDVGTENQIAIPLPELDKLLGHCDGSAALLYLHIRRTGGFSLGRAARELKCTEAELKAAAGTLRGLGLLDAPEQTPERETPEYSAEDVTALARTDGAFEAVVGEAERALGRVLSSSDLKLLFGIYDYWGLQADVIMLLLHHCVETYQERYGAGRKPAMRYIEKEAQDWARMEINTLDAAEERIRREKERRAAAGRVREALQIRDRAPTASEARYIDDWLALGFGPEAIAEAYDRTVLNTGKLTWKYLDRILRSWDEKHFHSLPEIEAGDPRRAAKAKPAESAKSDSEKLDAMRRMYEHMSSGSRRDGNGA